MSLTRLAFLGDSLFEGYALNRNEAFPIVMERELRAAGYDVEAFNFGISGETAHEGLMRMDSVLTSEPHAVLLEFGANDFYMQEPPAEVRDNLAAMLRMFAEKGIPVLLVGINALSGVVNKQYRAAFNPIYGELAEEFDVPLYPNILAPYYGNPLLTLMDGIHPNDQGVEAMVRSMLPAVKDLLDSL